MITPYGIYDLGEDGGWVNVGTDRNTAAFAVDSIRRWCATLAREMGLPITVCHFTPATSERNKVEHRLFSRITCARRTAQP